MSIHSAGELQPDHVLRRVAWAAYRTPRAVMLAFIRAWRAVLSPLYGPRCKYYPSCSSYGLAAVTTHGAVRGGALTIWRICRCNPFSHGGVDDVPPQRPALALTRWLAPRAHSAAQSAAPGATLNLHPVTVPGFDSTNDCDGACDEPSSRRRVA